MQRLRKKGIPIDGMRYNFIGFIVVHDHFPKGFEHAIVHVGSRQRNITQGAYLESAHVPRIMGNGGTATIRKMNAVVKADVPELHIVEISPEMTTNTACLA